MHLNDPDIHAIYLSRINTAGCAPVTMDPDTEQSVSWIPLPAFYGGTMHRAFICWRFFNAL